MAGLHGSFSVPARSLIAEMAICQACGEKAFVIDSRRNDSGDIRRRFRCKKCSHSWTEWNGPRPKSSAPTKRMPDDVILDILTDPLPQYDLSIRHNCSMSAVGKIRRGELHADVHPEIPRYKSTIKTGRKTCPKCVYYTGKRDHPCDLGHIDPIEEGLTFASYCANFTRITS